MLTARNYAEAVIPIEKFRGALMIIAGRDDQLWPSAEMADQIRSRRSASLFAARDRYLLYRRAGHQIGKAGLPQAESTRIAGGRLETGGTLAENALAQRDSWPRVLEFFAAHLQ
jgi:dienelactone hydrolase